MTEFYLKATRALQSARILLDASDTDGACNRAYYAMFDAAKPALLHVDGEVLPTEIRTHNGLMSKFNLHLIKPGCIGVEFGRALKQVESLRLTADYRSDAFVSIEDALWAVERASEFVGEVKGFLDRKQAGC